MKKCNNCCVDVMDGESVCPLCQNGLEITEFEDKEPMYPKIIFDTHKYNIVIRVFIFLSVALGFVLATINYMQFSGSWWSLISIGAIVYFWITIGFSVRNNANSAAKILVQTLGGVALVILIDFVVGYQGWSVNYAVPAIFLVANFSMLVLMMVNFMNWQSYILFQIEYVFFSLILLILYFVGIITSPVLTFLVIGSSVLSLVGTMIFGDKKAKNELVRRFHL